MILAVLAIFLLMGSVSAESSIQDDSADLVANTDNGLISDNLLASTNDKVYEINNTDDWTNVWTDMKPFPGKITLNINVDLDITGLLAEEDYYYNSRFASDTLIINGNGHTIHSDNKFNFFSEHFEGSNQRFLEIYGKNVILNDLRFNGFGLMSTQYRGGLVYMSDNAYLEVNNCIISSNDLGVGGLGVITLEGYNTKLKMTNVTIQDTHISAKSKSGGVYVLNPTAEAQLYNCTFKNIGAPFKYPNEDNSNKHPYYGGAIYTYGKLYCEGCTFENLIAEYGAAIYIDGSQANVDIQSSNFINCKAANNGIIYVDGASTKNVALTRCSFINSQQIIKHSNPSIIYLNNRYQEITLTKCVFYNSNPVNNPVNNMYIAHLDAAGNNQKIVFDQCYRYGMPTIGNTGHGTWIQNWVTTEVLGDVTARLHDTKTFMLVFANEHRPNQAFGIISDMAYCPALPVQIGLQTGSYNIFSTLSVVPMNQKNKGTFDVKFDQLGVYNFILTSYTMPGIKIAHTVNVGEGYVSLDTNLIKDIVNNISQGEVISLNLYYNDNKKSPLVNKNVYYSLDNDGSKTLIGTTDEKGHIDLRLDNSVTGKHNITFSTDPEPGIVPLDVTYTIFVKKDTKFVDVTTESTNTDFIISGYLKDSSNNPLNQPVVIQIRGNSIEISENVTSDGIGMISYHSGFKLPKGTYIVSLIFKGNEQYIGTSYVSQAIVDGKTTVLNVPSEISGILDSEITIPANLTVATKTHNLTNGVWFYTTQDWYNKFMTGRCTFDDIQWYNNASQKPVNLTYNNGIALVINGGNAKMDFSLLPDAGNYYAFFLVKADEDLDSSDAFAFSSLIVKLDSDLEVIPSSTSITYGEDVELIILNEYATGLAEIYINGTLNQTVYIGEGYGSALLKGLKLGTYEVEVRYLGDNIYLPANKTVYITVNKKELDFDVIVDDAIINETVVAYIIGIPDDATGNYTIFINNEEYGTYDVSVTNVTLNNLKVGEYMIQVIYWGDNIYNLADAYDTFTISNGFEITPVDNPFITFIDDLKPYRVLVTDDKEPLSDTVVTFTINGMTYTRITNEQGIAELLIDLDLGEYEVKVSSGDVVFNDTIYVVERGFEITPVETPFITFIDDLKPYRVLVTQDTVPFSGAVVKFTVNGVTYSKITDEKGIAELPIDLAPGDYNIVVSSGDVVFNDTIRVVDRGFEITPVETPFSIFYGDWKPYRVLVTYNKELLGNAVVKFTVNGVTYSKITDEQGIAELPIDLAPADYDIVVSSGGVVFNDTIHVKSTIEGQDIVKYYLNDTQFYATFLDGDGKPLADSEVMFKINGVSYYRYTNGQGVAKLNINLNPGDYIITAVNPVNQEEKSFNVKVLHTVIGKDLVMYFRDGSRYECIAVDDYGNPLSGVHLIYNIHGIFYEKVTDEKGIAALKINLSPGEYIVTVLNPVTGECFSNSITVQHTINAKDLTMLYKDGSKYECKVVDFEGNPWSGVHLIYNIHGIFYEKVTDENGIAGLTINLSPGDYIVTVYNTVTDEALSNTITVLPVIISSDIEMFYNDGTCYECLLVDTENQPVPDEIIEVNINGVIHYIKTDIRGIARLPIDLQPGEYVVTARHNDAAASNKITVYP